MINQILIFHNKNIVCGQYIREVYHIGRASCPYPFSQGPGHPGVTVGKEGKGFSLSLTVPSLLPSGPPCSLLF